MKEMDPKQFKSLADKVDMILSEVHQIKEWQAKVDRGIEGEPVHGNPSYIDRINNNKDEIERVAENTRNAHLRIDKIIYITAGVGAGSGGITAGILKLILGL